MSDHLQHKFPVEKLHKLHRPERLEELRPKAFLEWAGVSASMTVADIGCGTGVFALEAAAQVGPDGLVYALDIAEPMLDYLRNQDLPAHLKVLGSEESSFPLSDNEIDLVILASVLHEAVARPAFLAEVNRIVKPGGRVACLEWKCLEQQKGPPLAGRIAQPDLRQLLEASGLEVAQMEAWSPSRYVALAQKPMETTG